MHALAYNLGLAAAALALEALGGYPDALYEAIGHPVGWMGRLIDFLEAHLNGAKASPARRRLAGAAALAFLLAAVGLIAQGFTSIVALGPENLAFFLLAVAATPLLAQKSLTLHVRAVAQALEGEGLAAARAAVAKIVGRDTSSLDEADVARAAIESLAESFCDGVVAPAFWIAISGLLGGALYKAVNTADSMIGHRTARYGDFGFASAKLDDLANWPGARLAALWLGLAALLLPGASAKAAWACVRRDARTHASPNAGWPEAAIAGALGFKLGGPRAYVEKKEGGLRADLWIGEGRADLDARDIRQALRLYRRACLVNWTAIAALALIARV